MAGSAFDFVKELTDEATLNQFPSKVILASQSISEKLSRLIQKQFLTFRKPYLKVIFKQTVPQTDLMLPSLMSGIQS